MISFTTTWRKELEEAFKITGDSFETLESVTLSDEELDRQFDGSHGTEQGTPFTAWSKTKVYFPACYDGAEWVAWVGRNPDKKPTMHVGGG